MNFITVGIFKILLVIGGLLLCYIIGKPLFETVQFFAQGHKVEGSVIGFKGRKNSTSVFTENTAKVRKKYIARRPVFRYPIVSGSLDSMDGYSKSTILLPWLNFKLREKVTVVMDKKDPARAHIISPGIFLTDIILLLCCFYMIKLGFTKSKS